MAIQTDNFTRTLPGPLVLLTSLMLVVMVTSGCQNHTHYRYSKYDAYPESRVTFRYHYYPDSHVYYDTQRHIYFYNNYRHGWISVKALPKHILLNKHHRQELKLHNRYPWKEHNFSRLRKKNNIQLKPDSHTKKSVVMPHRNFAREKVILKQSVRPEIRQHHLHNNRQIKNNKVHSKNINSRDRRNTKDKAIYKKRKKSFLPLSIHKEKQLKQLGKPVIRKINRSEYRSSRNIQSGKSLKSAKDLSIEKGRLSYKAKNIKNRRHKIMNTHPGVRDRKPLQANKKKRNQRKHEQEISIIGQH